MSYFRWLSPLPFYRWLFRRTDSSPRPPTEAQALLLAEKNGHSDSSIGYCPYCAARLEPRPTRKKQCPTCGQTMYVRHGMLVTASDAKIAAAGTPEPMAKQ